VAANLNAAGAVMRRDLRLTLSYRFSFVAQLAGMFFSLTLFYYISRLVRVQSFQSADSYYAFAVVGLLILQVLQSGLVTPPNSLRQELVAGTFERLAVSPFGPVGSVFSMTLFPFAYALLAGAVMVLFASVAFGMPIDWTTAPLAIPCALLGVLAFAPFGVLIAAVVMVIKQAATATTLVLAIVSLVGGLYFPIALLPGWVRWMSDVEPFTPAVALLRHVLVGSTMHTQPWLDVAQLLGFAVVLLPIAVIALHGAIRISRRRGTLAEY